MKKRKRAASVSSPDYHPATGQILSEVEESGYLAKKPRKTKAKRRATVTIAPGSHSTRDVFINRNK